MSIATPAHAIGFAQRMGQALLASIWGRSPALQSHDWNNRTEW
jgi:hypothetical protein